MGQWKARVSRDCKSFKGLSRGSRDGKVRVSRDGKAKVSRGDKARVSRDGKARVSRGDKARVSRDGKTRVSRDGKARQGCLVCLMLERRKERRVEEYFTLYIHEET